MPMDESVRLRMIVEGEAELEKLKATLAESRTKVDELYASMGKGADFVAAAAPHLEDMAGALKGIGDQQQELAKLGSGFSNLNNQIFQTGRVLQDFVAGATYGGIRGGFVAIANNIEQLAVSFGLGTAAVQGMAVAMTLLPMAIPALERVFRPLFDLFRDEAPKIFASRLDELRARLKEFEDKKVKVAFDYTEIEETKKRIAEVEAARSVLERTLRAQTRAEAESGRRIEEAITVTPGAQDLLIQMQRRAGEAAARGEGPQGVAVAARQQEIARIRDRMAELDKAIGRGGEGTESLIAEWAKLNERLGDQASRLAMDQKKAAAAAEEEIGKVIHQAEAGREAEQQQAQQRLARMFAATGTEAGKAAARAILDVDAVKVAQEEEIRAAKAETDRLAHDLARGPLGVEFLRGAEITPDRIRAELERTLPPETAAKWANEVAKAFTEALAIQVADEAHRTGVAPEEARRQIAAHMEAALPAGRERAEQVRDRAEQARRAIRGEEERQREAAGRFPDLDLTIRQELLKQRQAGLAPGEAQDIAFRRAEQELRRRGVAPDLAEPAAARMTMRAIAELGKLLESFGGAADALGQARRVLEREGIQQRARLAPINPADAQAAARAAAEQAMRGQQERAARLGAQAADPAAGALLQRERQAEAAVQLNETYQRFFRATGNKDLAAFLALQELSRTQVQAAANAQAMASGFRSLAEQQRAIQLQLQGIAKSFQLGGRR